MPRLRTQALLWALVGAYIAFVAWELGNGYQAARRGDTPRYTDFTSLYAASLLVRRQSPEDLYRPREMFRATIDAAHAAYGPGLSDAQASRIGYAPWMYPPPFILASAPLAALPYLPAFFAWIVLTGMLYVAALRAILPSSAAPAAIAFASPPAFFNLAYGQTGFLSGGLIGLGLALLQRRPVLAGVCIGLASVKPHLGLLIPFALAAGGYWRSFAAAAATVLLLIVLSVIVLGADPWYGFIGTLLSHLDGFRAGAYTWSAMTSVLAAAHLAGLPLPTAWTLQTLATIGMILLVITTWRQGKRQPETLGLQCAILCLATPLAIPMAYLYDLCVIVPGAAWLWLDLKRNGGTSGEKLALLALMAALLPAFLAAARLDLPLGTLALAGLTLLACWRFALRAGALQHKA